MRLVFGPAHEIYRLYVAPWPSMRPGVFLCRNALLKYRKFMQNKAACLISAVSVIF